jgi:sugar lactone lactonase YvrE
MSCAVSSLAGSGHAGFENRRGTASQLNNPINLTITTYGDVLIADWGNHCIRKISPFGDVTTFAGTGVTGHVDGPRASAEFATPCGIAADSAGNVYVADNHCIRHISPDGEVRTIAGQPGTPGFADGQGTAAMFNTPYDLAIDGEGNLIVADCLNHRIRRVTPQGDVVTIAGGPPGELNAIGEAARFNEPKAVAVSRSGDILVSDNRSGTIRRIQPDRTVTTVASMAEPRGLAFDGDDNLYVSCGFLVRKISSTGDKTVTVLAGTNSGAGYSDGAPSDARFQNLTGIAIDAEGNILVCGGDHRIRVIAAGVTPPPILPLPQIPPSSRVAQMAALLSDPSRADVTFVVEGEKIKAHSVLLAARSEYFERMLCGGFAEAGSSAAGSAAQIPIQNTTPAAFRALLRYLYTDELAFSEDDVRARARSPRRSSLDLSGAP